MSSPQPVLTPATVLSAWDETPLLRGLTLQVNDDALRAHLSAGQYVKLSVLGVEGHFALAAAPGRPFELLVKRGSALGDAMAGLAPGAEIAASLPLGNGYPLAHHRGRDVHLFAVGSGIAPVRAVIDAIRGDRNAWGRVTVWDGQRQEDHLAYRAERTAWASDRIEVMECLSSPTGEWSGPRGRVQEVFEVRPPELSPDAVAYVCGMKAFVEDVKGRLGARGLSAERIFQNF